jgi:hypothetical protein
MNHRGINSYLSLLVPPVNPWLNLQGLKWPVELKKDTEMTVVKKFSKGYFTETEVNMTCCLSMSLLYSRQEQS